MRTYKSFPICERHGTTYRYEDGCKKCNEIKRNKLRKQKEKPIDKALREMEEKKLISSTEKEETCAYCFENKASGDSYRFKPICHTCLDSKSKRYREQHDKDNDNNS